jgi:hypothetical protein
MHPCKSLGNYPVGCLVVEHKQAAELAGRTFVGSHTASLQGNHQVVGEDTAGLDKVELDTAELDMIALGILSVQLDSYQVEVHQKMSAEEIEDCMRQVDIAELDMDYYLVMEARCYTAGVSDPFRYSI